MGIAQADLLVLSVLVDNDRSLDNIISYSISSRYQQLYTLNWLLKKKYVSFFQDISFKRKITKKSYAGILITRMIFRLLRPEFLF